MRPISPIPRFPLVLTFGLLLFSLAATRGAESAPTCKVTVVATNNWVAAQNGARLYSVLANNISGSSLYLFIVNTNSTPGNGAPPALPALLLPTTSTGGYDFHNVGFTFSAGMAICASSTPDSLTLSAAGTFTIAVNYLGK
jgi:hypothetical protein